MKSVLFLPLLLIVQQTQSQLMVAINNGSHLVDVLCTSNGEPISDDVTIYLNSSIQYNISNQWPISCVVKVSSGLLTITSTTNTPANVTCIDKNDSDTVPTVGFLFTGMSNVTLSNLLITGCGASLAEYNNTINSTQPYFAQDHSGLFIFFNTSVNITRVAIIRYYGFAIIIKDTRETLLNEILLKHDIGNYDNIGVGLLVLFTEDLTFSPLFTISNSIFETSLHQNENSPQFCDFEATTQHSLLTILLRNNLFQPTILITNINFTETVLSGLLLSVSNSVGGHVTITQIKHTAVAPTTCTGSVVTIYGNNICGPTLIEITNTIFQSNLSYRMNSSNTLSEYGPVLVNTMNLQKQVTLYFRNVTFQNNTPSLNGACLTVTHCSTAYKISVILESVIAHSNSQKLWGSFLYNTGLFVIDNANQIVINGTHLYPGQFYDNIGSVIEAKNSVVIFKGNVMFANNYARNGAVLNAKDTVLYFEKSLTFAMINNTVKEIGGALYIVNSFHQDLPNCALQLADKLNVTATDNTAYLSGNIGYIYPLYHCYSQSQGIVITTTEYYLNGLGAANSYESNNHRLAFSTIAKNMEICGADMLKLMYFGQTNHFLVRVFDWSNQTVRSQVKVSFQQTKHSILDNHLNIEEGLQYTNESSEGKCSQINFKIISSTNYLTKSENFNIVLSAPGVKTFIIQQIQLLPCPPGFQLMNGICQCSNTVMQFYKDLKYKGICDIYGLTISKPLFVYPWIGINLGNRKFTIVKNCPLETCGFQTEQSVFKYSDPNYDVLIHSGSNTNTSPICLSHRQGVACGQCSEGYSVVFGSNDCKKCSNWWVWTIFIYLLAGPVLIFLLYALKLTLTAGTINGLIFFAQVLYAGVIQTDIITDSNRINYIFISFLNLNLGFSLCFFNGMNDLWKGAVNLLFPIYLIALIGLIVVISRFWLWFSKKVSPHSIQVLVTVVHLSVSTLLISVINVSVPINVWTANGTHKVWRKDGSVEYMSRYHAILFTATLVVAISILFPYLTVLVFGTWCSKKSASCSIYIRPIQEAVNAPYKEKYQYWFTGKLLFVILVYSLYAFNRSTNNKLAVVYIPLMLAALFLTQAFLRPLKNKLLNVIELIFIFSTAVTFTAYYIGIRLTDQKPLTIAYSISVYISIIIFIGVIAYHVTLATGYLGQVNAKMQRLFLKFKQRMATTKETEVNPSSRYEIQESFYVSVNDYREPLIGHTTVDI